MYREPVLECTYPSMDSYKHFHCDDFVEHGDLIVSYMTATKKTETRCSHYLCIFNRIAKGWFAPVRLPSPYNEDFWCNLIGCVHERTVVLFCEQKSSGMLFVCCFRLSRTLDSLTLVESSPFATHPFHFPFPVCFGFFPSSDGLRIVCYVSGVPCIYSCTTSTSTELPLDGLRTYDYAMMYADVLYFVCVHLNLDRAIYTHTNGQLECVTDCEVYHYFVPGSINAVKITHHGSRLFFVFWVDRWKSADVFIFDVSTRAWTLGGIARFSGLPMRFPNNAFCGVGRAEIWAYVDPHDNAGRRRRKSPLAQDNAGKERRLYSMSFLPATLGTCALRVVHKHIPRHTAERLEVEQASVRSTTDLVAFLFKQ